MDDFALETLDFESERLRFRPLRDIDESLYCALYADAETMRFIGPPMSREQARRSFRTTLRLLRKQPIEWVSIALEEKASAQTIGICGIPHFDGRAKRLEVGMMLCKAVRGRAYSKEGLGSLVGRLFAVLPVEELCVEYSPENLAAGKLASGVGFLPNREISPKIKTNCVCSVDRRTVRNLTL